MRRVVILSALGIALAGGAGAGPEFPRIETDGHATLGAVAGTGSSEAVGQLDLTAGMHIAGPVDLELGTYGILLGGKRPHETYAALAIRDRLRFGVVRPAYDAVLPSIFETAAPRLAYDLVRSNRSFATVAAMKQTAVPFGVSYDGGDGAFRWAMSVHDAAKGDFRAVSASVASDLSQVALSAAIEGVWDRDGHPEGANAKIGMSVEHGALSTGVALIHAGANDAAAALDLRLDLDAGARTTVSALAHGAADPDESAWGVSAERRIGRRDDSLGAALLHERRGTAFHAGLTHRF